MNVLPTLVKLAGGIISVYRKIDDRNISILLAGGLGVKDPNDTFYYFYRFG